MKSSLNGIDILEVLNSTKAQTYSELKSLAGFNPKLDHGKFAHYIRKLTGGYHGFESIRHPMVVLNKSNGKYRITSHGKLVLILARHIEERKTTTV